MKKYSVVIVDDETLARENLSVLLADDKEVEIKALCANGLEALKSVSQSKPDIMFLDIQMPKMNGFDVLGEIVSDEMPVVVFVTAFDNYALRAFEVNALDYLLKPFSDARFKQSLERAKQQVTQRNLQTPKLIELLEKHFDNQTNYLNRIVIKSIGRVQFLRVDEIDWISADSNYVEIHSKNKTHLLRETIGNLEAKLDPRRFLRIHRSTIVNLDSVKELKPSFRGEYVVILHDGTQLKLSRSNRDKLELLFDGKV